MTEDRAYGPLAERQERWERHVSDERELRRAISLYSRSAASNRTAPGGCIIISAPMSLSRPVIIATPGLRITASSRFPITPTGVLATVFDVRAEMIHIDSLYIYAASINNYATTFVTLTGSSDVGRGSTACTVRDCRVYCDRLLVDASAGDSDVLVLEDNIQIGINAAHAGSVVIDSRFALVSGNILNSGASASITLSANAGDAAVYGNDLGGGAITSSASSGRNRFGENRNTGAKTYAATDLDADAYSVVMDEAVALAMRPRINFVGTGVTAVDDAANDRTNVTIPGVVGTTVETNIGATEKWTGKFTITDATITATSKVLCWQAPGPYTGKGTRADEAELQPVSVIAVEPAAGSAIVKWQTPPMVVDVPLLTTGIIGTNRDPQTTARRLGVVRGNVKFSYLVL